MMLAANNHATLSMTPDHKDNRLSPPRPALVVENLTMRFGGGCAHCFDTTGPITSTSRCSECGSVVALHEVGLEVGPGEVLGVAGESGSGKTSLLRCLHRELTPESGRAIVEGVGDLFDPSLSDRRVRTEIAVLMHQNAATAGLSPSLSAEANVAERFLATGLRNFAEMRHRVGEALSGLGVESDRHANLLSTFSGGMQQRVQLARALVQPPPLLLLDEPTSGLDPSVQAASLGLLQEVVDNLGGATIVVSHDLRMLRLLCPRITVLRFGRIVESGLTDQVLEDPRHPYTQLLVSSQL
jgi:putative phosphonate transport system ATP-binding protein